MSDNNAELIKQRIREEYAKCSTDFIYFFKKYLVIAHPVKGKISFNLYPFQERTLEELHKNKYTVINKGRQLGISTLVAGYALWKMTFKSDYKILVLATTQPTAIALVDKVTLMHTKLPSWLKEQTKTENKQKLEYKNGSSIVAVSSSEKSARSPSLSLLIVDEAAFIDDFEDIWIASQATLACIDFNSLILTPNGFHRIGELCKPEYNIGFNDTILEIVNQNGEIETSDSYFISEDSDVFEVTLNNGNTIITTKEHPLFTRDGWRRVDELRVGVDVKCIYNTQLFGKQIEYPEFELHGNSKHRVSDVSNDDLAYFYGLYIAEGHRSEDYRYKTPSIGITNTDDGVQKFLMDKFNFKLYDDRHLKATNSHLALYMNYVGLDFSNAKDKKVPSKILNASRSEQIQFLKGAFDGDGCATTIGSIKYTSISKQLVLDIQQMLFNFGIRSAIRYQESPTHKTSRAYKHNPKHIYRGYDLVIYGNDAVKFFDIIGFRLTRKQSRRAECKNGENIPVGKELVYKIIKNGGYTFTHVKCNIANVTRLLYKGSKSITRFSMESILNNISSDVDGWVELNALYTNHINSNFFYEKVVSVKCVGRRRTYDLKVPKSHSFIANSIINHNTGGDAILLSSPNGMGNIFHKICVEAQEGTHDTSAHAFQYIELPWHLHPDRDAKWAAEQLTKLGKRGFAQEHECSFLGSGHTLVEGDIIQWYLDNVCKEPIERRYPNSDYWIWKYPDYNKSYVVVADVGRGDGNDYSTFHVLEVESMEQVASFRSKIDTREFGNLLVSVATDYNNALLVIDNKGIGWDVVQVALDRAYSNLYYSYRNDPFLDDNIQLKKHYDLKDKSDMVPGFTTATKNRLVIISKIETNVREKVVIINDKRTANELLTFMWINGKVQAQRGYNDDLLMALGIGYFVRDTALRLRQHGIDLTKRSLSSTHKSVYKPTSANRDAFKLKTGRGGEEDISWLVQK